MAYRAPPRPACPPRHAALVSSLGQAEWFLLMRSKSVNVLEKEPTFLTIRWELPHREEGRVVVVQAVLCLAHRREIALKYPSAQGCKQLGDSCDLCEVRQPRRL